MSTEKAAAKAPVEEMTDEQAIDIVLAAARDAKAEEQQRRPQRRRQQVLQELRRMVAIRKSSSLKRGRAYRELPWDERAYQEEEKERKQKEARLG